MKTKTLNIALPQALIKKIDRAAKKEYRNRSELIREALRVYLKEIQEWDGLLGYGQERAAALGIKTEKAIDRIVYQFRHGKRAA